MIESYETGHRPAFRTVVWDLILIVPKLAGWGFAAKGSGWLLKWLKITGEAAEAVNEAEKFLKASKVLKTILQIDSVIEIGRDPYLLYASYAGVRDVLKKGVANASTEELVSLGLNSFFLVVAGATARARINILKEIAQTVEVQSRWQLARVGAQLAFQGFAVQPDGTILLMKGTPEPPGGRTRVSKSPGEGGAAPKEPVSPPAADPNVPSPSETSAAKKGAVSSSEPPLRPLLSHLPKPIQDFLGGAKEDARSVYLSPLGEKMLVETPTKKGSRHELFESANSGREKAPAKSKQGFKEAWKNARGVAFLKNGKRYFWFEDLAGVLPKEVVGDGLLLLGKGGIKYVFLRFNREANRLEALYLYPPPFHGFLELEIRATKAAREALGFEDLEIYETHLMVDPITGKEAQGPMERMTTVSYATAKKRSDITLDRLTAGQIEKLVPGNLVAIWYDYLKRYWDSGYVYLDRVFDATVFGKVRGKENQPLLADLNLVNSVPGSVPVLADGTRGPIFPVDLRHMVDFMCDGKVALALKGVRRDRWAYALDDVLFEHGFDAFLDPSLPVPAARRALIDELQAEILRHPDVAHEEDLALAVAERLLRASEHGADVLGTLDSRNEIFLALDRYLEIVQGVPSTTWSFANRSVYLRFLGEIGRQDIVELRGLSRDPSVPTGVKLDPVPPNFATSATPTLGKIGLPYAGIEGATLRQELENGIRTLAENPVRRAEIGYELGLFLGTLQKESDVVFTHLRALLDQADLTSILIDVVRSNRQGAFRNVLKGNGNKLGFFKKFLGWYLFPEAGLFDDSVAKPPALNEIGAKSDRGRANKIRLGPPAGWTQGDFPAAHYLPAERYFEYRNILVPSEHIGAVKRLYSRLGKARNGHSNGSDFVLPSLWENGGGVSIAELSELGFFRISSPGSARPIARMNRNGEFEILDMPADASAVQRLADAFRALARSTLAEEQGILGAMYALFSADGEWITLARGLVRGENHLTVLLPDLTSTSPPPTN
ncbi:MAG TPA: hypothetical protein VI895_08290 [Bdellovibrionota bacterium]|nr:hypothetical protein [Bdellovibrionota bacterium]